MCIGGGGGMSFSEQSALNAQNAALNRPAAQPTMPVRADETRIQNTVAGLQAIRRQAGRSATILTGGGSGAVNYGMAGAPMTGLGGTRLGG